MWWCGSASQCGVCIVCCAEHSTQYTHHKLPHNLTECFNINTTLARLNCKLPDGGRRTKLVGAI